MSDDNNSNNDKIIGLKLKLSECEHGSHLHVTDVKPLRESDVVYSAPDAETALGSSTVGGGSPLYNANWERMFGAAAADDNVN